MAGKGINSSNTHSHRLSRLRRKKEGVNAKSQGNKKKMCKENRGFAM